LLSVSEALLYNQYLSAPPNISGGMSNKHHANETPTAPLAGFPFHANKLQGIQAKANN